MLSAPAGEVAGERMLRHRVLVQAANYAVYPLQIVLLIPFMRLGERVTGAAHMPLSAAAIVGAFMSGIGHAFPTLSLALAHASLGWALCAVPAALAIYAVTKPVMARVAVRMAAGDTPSVT